jgi:NADH:ubiquinone oxidoreductase subunit
MRRVLFAKEVQASAVPAEWWGWLHHTTEQPLPEDAPRRAWQKEHRPNMTGTAEAWRPWRGYAVIHLWRQLESPKTEQSIDHPSTRTPS